MIASEMLAPDLVEQVLVKLGLPGRPEPTLAGLVGVYGAWCRMVPSDNVRKRIHLSSGATGALPGDGAVDFFANWLRHGAGGTCWAGNGALYTLLTTLGFSAARGIGTMMTSPNTPPNHGTVRVDLDGERYLVDASILHGEPLRLAENSTTATGPGAWGVQCAMRADRWHIQWRPLHTPDGITCRIERLDASAGEFHDAHEDTRSWSLFNYAVSARLIRGDAIVGLALGQRATLDAAGVVNSGPLTPAERMALLIEQLGMSEEIVSQLPPDQPTPPPPWAAPAA